MNISELSFLVEMMGFEPMTPCLQGRCSPSWATPPYCYGILLSPLFKQLISKLFGRPKWTRTTFKTYLSLRSRKAAFAFKGFFVYLVLLVGPSGLEPPTSCLSGTRSNLLSYEPMWLVSDFCFTWFSSISGEAFVCLPRLKMSALSYFPVQSPVKYLHHCRA